VSIDIWTAGDLFTLRVYKRLVNRQDLVWANTYELQVNSSGNGGGTDNAEQVANVVAEFESGLHLADVQFDRGVFSTLVPDGQPYDPDTFASYDLSGISGQRPTGAPMSLQNCLRIRKAVAFGRAGRFLYRRCLDESEVTSQSGDPVLTGAARETFDAALVLPLSTTEDFLSSLSSLGVDLVMVGIAGGVTRVRRVNGLAANGVTVKPYNNRYFDRA
jgi:hypothetical protein